MIYKSNRTIYVTTKYGLLFGVIVIAGIEILVALDPKAREAFTFLTILNTILIVIFYLIFRFVVRVLVEVEVSNDGITIPSKSLTFGWTDIHRIGFTMWGLYRLETADEVFYFPPFDLSIHFFGYKINKDDFDLLIEKRKKELKI